MLSSSSPGSSGHQELRDLGERRASARLEEPEVSLELAGIAEIDLTGTWCIIKLILSNVYISRIDLYRTLNNPHASNP